MSPATKQVDIKPAPIKKGSPQTRFNMNSNVGRLLADRLKDPAFKHLKAKELFESDPSFAKSGINLKQFRSAMVRIKSRLGEFMDESEEGYGAGKMMFLIFLNYYFFF